MTPFDDSVSSKGVIEDCPFSLRLNAYKKRVSAARKYRKNMFFQCVTKSFFGAERPCKGFLHLKSKNRLATRDQTPLEEQNSCEIGGRSARTQFSAFLSTQTGLVSPAQRFLGASPPTKNRPLGRPRLFAGAGVFVGSPASFVFAGQKRRIRFYG